MRLPQVEREAGVAFRWRPFSIRTIMIEMDNRPMGKPAKLAYIWRDVERRAEMYGCAFRGRPAYPLKDFDLANRIAVVGANEGWCADYVRAADRRWFIEGQPAGSEPSNTESLREIGQEAPRVLDLAATDATGQAYDAATDAARGLGIFGVPTFVTRGELFWGDDRLDDAVRWHRFGTLAG